MRLFVAVGVPAALHGALVAAQDRLGASGADVRWVTPVRLHFTLKFLGEVPESRVQDISAALANLSKRHARFGVGLHGVGAFPTPRRPRVIWAGVSAGEAALGALAVGVEDALAACGCPRERRPFSTHLTLGRVKRATPDLTRRIAQEAETDFGPMRVTMVVLMCSVLHRDGPEYSAVSEHPLAGGAEERG